jgi:hypothetical protein
MPGRSAQDAVEVLEVVIGVDQLADGGVELGDLVLQGLDDLVDGPQRDGGTTGHRAAVGLLGQRLLQLSPAGDQDRELGLILRAALEQQGLGQLGVAHQDGGIDRVGLGEDLQADREVADVGRVDVGHGQVGVEQRCDQRPLVPPVDSTTTMQAGRWVANCLTIRS